MDFTAITRQAIEKPSFIEDINNALNSAPSVCFSISNREDLNAFVKAIAPKQKGYLGRKISCKHANSNMPMNYSAKEIFSFTSDKYPLELHFKSQQDLEDFAIGYDKAAQTIPAPKEVVNSEKIVISAADPANKGRRQEEARRGTTESNQDKYSANPRAEGFLNTLLIILKIVSWVLAIGSILFAIVSVLEGLNPLFVLSGFLGGGLILLYYYFIWALFKVVLNISNNLFGIRAEIKDIISRT